MQYSVLAVNLSATEMTCLMEQLAEIIDPNEDDLRAYDLPANGWRVTLGQSMLPDDVLLV